MRLLKEQIKKLLKGIFDYDTPAVTVSESSIECNVDSNTITQRELQVRSLNNIELSGYVYSTNKKVVIDTPEFRGNESIIKYEINTADNENGDEISGKINIVSNGGEISLPFCFRVETNFADTSMGKVRNMFHFTNLAQSGIEEAIKLFKTREFSEVFFEKDLNKLSLYDGLINQQDKRHALEEFLIAVRKKNRINLYIKGNEKIYTDIEESFEEKITIIKDSWGYISGTIECDDGFVSVRKNTFTTEDFVGSIMELHYIIDYDKLRLGNNYARIKIITMFQTIEYRITVVKTKEDLKKEYHSKHLEQQRIQFELMNMYFDYRTDKIPANDFTKIALANTAKLRKLDEENVFYKLLEAQLYAGDGKTSEAMWLIDSVAGKVLEEKREAPELYCYLYYIRSLCNKDILYTREAVRTLTEMFNRTGSYKIMWMLFYINGEYDTNKSLRIARVKELYKNGCKSPIMYFEVANVFLEQPGLLRVFNSFEKQVLNFMMKHGMMNERLLIQILDVMNHEKKADKLLIDTAMLLYHIYRTEEALTTVCSMLIRNNIYGKKYLKIFEEAIRLDLKITRLYDYYMLSVDVNEYEPIIQQVLMYYMYNSNLDRNKKAYLYANIIANKEINDTMYKAYIKNIENFAYEMVEQGAINQDLAVIYNTVIERQMINEEFAKNFIDILFTNKITLKTKLNEINEVIVIHKEVKGEEVYKVTNNVAYVRIYTDDPVIVFVAKDGKRYVDIPFEKVALFDDDELIRTCSEYLKDDERVVLFNSENFIRYHKTTLSAVEMYKKAACIPNIQKHYKTVLLETVVNYYYENLDDDDIESYVLEMDVSILNRSERIKIIEAMIIRGFYDSAYELIKNCDFERLDPKRLMKLATRCVRNFEYEYDKNLLFMCSFVFFKGKYDEVILEYLIQYYNGTTKELIEIWQAARDFITETLELDERLITQMMFSKIYSSKLADIFDEYAQKGACNNIARAYLAYNSYQSFVKEKIVSEKVFYYIEKLLKEKEEVLDVCKLAYLKEMSSHDTYTEEEREIIESILEEMCRKKYRFAFFKDFKKAVNVPYSILDKTIVEYRTNPKNKVIMHYLSEQDNSSEFKLDKMNNTFEGIFTKEFTIFYGDTVQYYITEEENQKGDITESHTLMNDEIDSQAVEGRFEAVNDMIATLEMNDDNTLENMMDNYAVSDYLVKKMFRPL